ncbi:MAG TPA: fibronectin type III domain-containing protein [Nocardioides sp.]|nr:fibronectin type III domain-containing protein [Nocardioides sp.]
MRLRHLLPLLLAPVLALAGTTAITASPASATTTTLDGTVLYHLGDDVYATDGTATRRLTTDGDTPAADGTGSTGYLYPSESDDGSVVVVARNQTKTNASDGQHYLRGYLWVLSPYGHVIRKINPPQYGYNGGTVCNMPANAPQGIANAHVSPDGRHIAYTITELIEVYGYYGCYVDTAYRTTVIDIDGTNAVPVDDGTGTATMNESLDVGQWADSSTLLVDRGDFGSVEVYRASLPDLSGTAWFGPDSYTDTAYMQPALRNGSLATIGLSDTTSTDVIRTWSSSGYGSAPAYRCEHASPVDSSDGLYDPSLSPDGSHATFEDTESDGSIAKAGQGVYVLDTHTCAATELVEGANDAFWSPASIDPPADTTAPSVSLTAPTAAAITATSTVVRWQGSDTGTGVASYQLQASGAGTGGWTDVGSAVGAGTTAETVTGLAPGSTTCFRVRATDGASNTATSAARCTAVPLDDRALSASRGWRRITGSGYFLGTATRTTTKGASLSRAGLTLDRVGVVATTCPSCGTVGAYVGGRLIGRISLVSSGTHNRVIKLLPRFTTRTGTVSLRVLSSRRTVVVDGLVSSRS